MFCLQVLPFRIFTGEDDGEISQRELALQRVNLLIHIYIYICFIEICVYIYIY